MVRRLLSMVLVLVLVAAGCGSDGDDPVAEPTAEPTAEPAPPTPTPARPAPTTPPTPTTVAVEPTATVAPAPRTVNVYWLRDTQLAAGGRQVATSAVATAAVEALLAGPDAAETALGMESALPDGVEVLGLTIGDGRAVIDLSPELESVSFGTFGELAMVAQVVFTLTQFPTVDEVDIWIGGVERDAILSHGLEARGLTRSAFYDAVAPAIVVERPVPGEQLGVPFTVTGFSRTFESTVVWELTSPPGDTVAASGFTTATQPDVGVHGPFELVVDADLPPGPALLTVFEESAEDGSRINVYEVSIVITGAE